MSTLSVQDQILVSLLAARNAWFAPVREFSSNASRNTPRWRRDYVKGGIPWSGRMGGVNRSASQRGLEGLIASKHVKCIRDAGRTTGVLLTEAGELRACSLTGEHTMAQSPDLFGRISDHAGAIPEDDLTSCVGAVPWVEGPERVEALQWIEALLVPFAAHRLIISHCTMRGNVLYSLTKTGGNATELGGMPDKSLECQEAMNVYGAEWELQFDLRRSQEPEDQQEIGEIPYVACFYRPTNEADVVAVMKRQAAAKSGGA